MEGGPSTDPDRSPCCPPLPWLAATLHHLQEALPTLRRGLGPLERSPSSLEKYQAVPTEQNKLLGHTGSRMTSKVTWYAVSPLVFREGANKGSFHSAPSRGAIRSCLGPSPSRRAISSRQIPTASLALVPTVKHNDLPACIVVHSFLWILPDGPSAVKGPYLP